jgi:hypothetical protein
MLTTLEKQMDKRSQKTGEDVQMSALEAQEAIWQLAPRDWIGKRKAAISKVARELGWQFARTWNIAHGRARRIDAHEMDALRAELNKLQEGAIKRRETLDGIEARVAYLRSLEGGGNTDRGGEGTSSAGGRGDGAGEGGVRAGECPASPIR